MAQKRILPAAQPPQSQANGQAVDFASLRQGLGLLPGEQHAGGHPPHKVTAEGMLHPCNAGLTIVGDLTVGTRAGRPRLGSTMGTNSGSIILCGNKTAVYRRKRTQMVTNLSLCQTKTQLHSHCSHAVKSLRSPE